MRMREIIGLAETVNPTDSLAFRKWFAGSKITDSQGKPLRVYHGTAGWDDGAIESFRPLTHFGGGMA